LQARTRRPTLCLLAAVCLAAAAAALAGCGSGGAPARAPDYGALRDAPGALGRLYAQGNQLLGGGAGAFAARLRELRGHPVVVNVWASWCGPCRVEFPYFQRLSARLGRRVAFLGVDSDDNAAAARTFLGEYPVPYPSYSDPDKEIFRAVAPNALGPPVTAFYDASGKQAYVHIGQFASAADLAAEIRRYAGA